MEFPYHRLPEGYLQVGSMLEHVLQDAVVAKGDSHGLLAMYGIVLGASGGVSSAKNHTVFWNCDARHLVFMEGGYSGCDSSRASGSER